MGIFDLFRRKEKSLKENTGKVFGAAATIGGPSLADVRAIALGVQSTVLMGIQCGGCGKQWKDALVPNEETRVVCPHCGGTNKPH